MGAVVVGGPPVDPGVSWFGVALAERDYSGRVNSASHWWRHDDGSAVRRWFVSEREAVLAVLAAGLDPERWAVWCFPAGRLFPECRGAVSELVEFDGQAVRL